MKKIMSFILILIAIYFIDVSCATAQVKVTLEKISHVKMYMKKDDIVSILGVPQRINVIGSFCVMLYETEENTFYLVALENDVNFGIKQVDPNDPDIRKLLELNVSQEVRKGERQ